MSYRTDLVTRLKANASIFALVADRLFFGQVPAEFSEQLVVRFFTYDGRAVTSMGSKSNTDDLKVQVDIMGPDLDEVEQLAGLIRSDLDNSTFGNCHKCRMVRNMDDFDKEDGGYRIMQEYQLWQRI